MVSALKLLDDEMPDEPGPDWRCADCDAVFKSERVFKLHQKQKHGLEDPFI